MASKEKKVKLRKTRDLIQLIMFLLFPVIIYYLSPVLPIEGAAEGIVSGSVLVFGGLFFSAFFFGRAWCGWVCPGGPLQDYAAKVNDKPARGKGWNLLKYILWVPWIIVIGLMFLRAGEVKSVEPFFRTEYGISAMNIGGWIVYFGVVLIILLLALFGRKRSFCHSVCWVAPFMLPGNRLRSKWKLPGLRLRAIPENCIQCGVCDKHCPMSLAVQDMVLKGDMWNAECILCGECVTHCPKDAIKFSLIKKSADK